MGCVRTKLAVVAEDERDGGRRQVLNLGPHGRARDRGGHRLRALPPRRGGRHRPAGGAAPVGPRRAARRGGRPARRARPAARVHRGRRSTRCSALVEPRQEARGRPRAVRARRGARRGDARATRSTPAALRAAVEEVHERMKEPRRGAARGQLRRARPAARRRTTAGSRWTRSRCRSSATRTSSTSTSRSPRPTTRASTARRCTTPTGDGLILNPGAWTHYSWAIRDALEVTGLPAVEVHLSAVDEREEWRRVSVIRDVCIGTVQGKGPEGYRDALALLRGAPAR